MRAGKVHRVKRQVLRQAVAENIDTIRGLPPRAVRPLRRGALVWLHRAPLLLVSLALVGSTFLTHGGAPAAPPPMPRPKPVILTQRPVLQAAVTSDPLVAMSTSVFPLSVHRVVIDAGHGGNDPGASAASKLTEKAVTLDVANRLRDLLRKSGFDVVVTRGNDRLVALRDRATIANTSNGDVLVATGMLAILAEVGCLSNDREAAMLGRAEYRQQIAQALFHGIHAYASAGDAPKKGSGNG